MKCSKCFCEKLSSDFVRNKKTCKLCRAIYHKEWHHKNKVFRLAQIRRYRETSVKKARDIVLEHIKGKCCIDCGETNQVVFEFDHVTGEKVADISKLIHLGSLEKLKEELKKCVIRCANCHRIKTSKEFGWYKYIGT